MAEAIRAGKDLHSMLGAQIIGTSYDDLRARVEAGDSAADAQRFHAKAGNFGFPGGMGPGGFVNYAKGYGIDIDESRARMLKSAWLRTWPEMNYYFSQIKGHFAGRETATMRLPVTGLYRGECWFTEACNFLFQGLAAAGAKRSGFRIARECFAVPTSPLFGSRPVFFLHDEWGCEVPEPGYSEAADRQAALMVESMREFVPDVPIKTGTPAVSHRWYKKAKGKRDASGRLLVWESVC
jgi:DNA polymerase I-like protein with 3'-5' exonuclease and polymerase domains